MPLRLFMEDEERINHHYFHQAEKLNNISEEEERILGFEAMAGDLDARNTLINSQLENAILIADKYRGLKILPFEDLFCEGNLGLLYAVEHFDPNKGRWPTYAEEWIKKFIKAALSNERNGLTGGESDRYARLRDELKKSLNSTRYRRDNKPIEPFDWMSLVLDLDEAPDFDSEDSGSMLTYEEIIPSSVETPENALVRKELEDKIQEVLKHYSPTEKDAVNQYFGLAGWKKHSVKDIAGILGIREAQAQRIINKALRRLRTDEKVKELRGYSKPE